MSAPARRERRKPTQANLEHAHALEALRLALDWAAGESTGWTHYGQPPTWVHLARAVLAMAKQRRGGR